MNTEEDRERRRVTHLKDHVSSACARPHSYSAYFCLSARGEEEVYEFTL